MSEKTAEELADELFNEGERIRKSETLDYRVKVADALDAYTAAAALGHAKACHQIGVMYANGLGVEKSYPEAVKWYRKAAEKGHAKAQYCLGYAYAHGEGVDQSYPEAVKWFRKAADQGYAGSQYRLERLEACK